MKKGFTLLELLATIAIMAVLIAAVLPFVSNYTTWAKNTQAKRSALIVADAINRYNSLVQVAADKSSLITGSEGQAAISARLLGTAQTVTVGDMTNKFIAKALTGVAFSSVSPKVHVSSPDGLANADF